MKNKMDDLRNALFVELETLQDEDGFRDDNGTIDKSKVELAIRRADAVNDVAGKIMELTKIQLEAVKIANDMGIMAELPDTLGIKENGYGNSRKALGTARY